MRTNANTSGSNGSKNGSPNGRLKERFRLCAHSISIAAGSPWAFLLTCVTLAVWAAAGPLFHFSDTWQLVINTATTIVTFLMVFLIQNTQNRDTKAIHLKLDELLKGVRGARTGLVNLEELSDEDLDHLQREFEKLRAKGKNARSERSAVRRHA